MSLSQFCAMPQNFSDFAQNFKICMCKLENSWFFSFLKLICPFLPTLWSCLEIFGPFSWAKFLNVKLWRRKKLIFRMSALFLILTRFFSSQISKLNFDYCWCFGMIYYPTFLIHQNFRIDLRYSWVLFNMKHLVEIIWKIMGGEETFFF